LGKRIQAYTRRVAKDQYEIINEELKEAECIVTLGFEKEYTYLAYALEAFLIAKIRSKYNKVLLS